jgi:MSHA pilin protein MshD
MYPLSTHCRNPVSTRRVRGLSLIELVIFIAVVSAALAAVLSVFIQTTGTSADPMLRRQSLAIAESVLEEVSLMPFTFCDGDDTNVTTATSTAGCAGGADAIGPEGGENRFATPQFDNVNDYGSYSMNGIVDITNTAVAGLSGYSASVAVTPVTLNTMTAASGDVLRISVTVTDPRGDTLTLYVYRTRLAPNDSL